MALISFWAMRRLPARAA